MHPHLITGNPFVIFTSRHFSLSLCFHHRFFLFWQKYRPNMMCILLKVQHNLLPLVCLQSQQSPTAQRGLPTATALFRRSRLFPGARVGVGDKEGPTLEGVAFLSGHSANQTPHDAAEPPLSRWGSRGVVDTRKLSPSPARRSSCPQSPWGVWDPSGENRPTAVCPAWSPAPARVSQREDGKRGVGWPSP